MRCVIFKLVSRVYRNLFHPQASTQTTQNIPEQTESDLSVETSPILKIIPHEQHNISKQSISENALKVLYRLNKQGYDAYLVGGCVRDLLLGQKPKDFDITTNATPEQVQKTFRNCRLVGRRFRLAHIMFGREIIEVATFRGEHADLDESVSTPPRKSDLNTSIRSHSGMLLRDNVYGTIEQDAMRRDYTINALYYNAKDLTIRDYCNGIDDLKNGVIRLIGDPKVRYHEDPVRMLRAIRFAAKLNMTIEQNTAEPIKNLAPLLKNIPGSRLFDESLKLLQTGHGYQTYCLLRKYQLFASLFPTIDRLFITQGVSKKASSSRVEQMIEQALKNTDYRIANNQRVNPAFLYAAILWYPLSEQAQSIILESGLSYHDAFDLAMSDILNEQCSIISIPKRLTLVMCDIWRLQLRLNKFTPKRINAVFVHPKFRAAYDLLELRASIEKGQLLELVKWWDEYQNVDTETRESMVQSAARLNQKQSKPRKPKTYRSHAANKKQESTQ